MFPEYTFSTSLPVFQWIIFVALYCIYWNLYIYPYPGSHNQGMENRGKWKSSLQGQIWGFHNSTYFIHYCSFTFTTENGLRYRHFFTNYSTCIPTGKTPRPPFICCNFILTSLNIHLWINCMRFVNFLHWRSCK